MEAYRGRKKSWKGGKERTRLFGESLRKGAGSWARGDTCQGMATSFFLFPILFTILLHFLLIFFSIFVLTESGRWGLHVCSNYLFGLVGIGLALYGFLCKMLAFLLNPTITSLSPITHHDAHPISIWRSFQLDAQESEKVQLSQAIKWLSICRSHAWLDIKFENPDYHLQR